MASKRKSRVWHLTIFANPNCTTAIYPHIYLQKNFYELPASLQNRILKHEAVHLSQQKKTGTLKFLFLYIFILPFFYNPYRYKWEYEAYSSTGHKPDYIKKILSSWHYGWLLNHK
ncbi:hypothetical protein HZB88_01165 [archaeon]|nr:hypothetical protein [archaeon]